MKIASLFLFLFLAFSGFAYSTCETCFKVHKYCQEQIPKLLMELYESDDLICAEKTQIYIDINNMIVIPNKISTNEFFCPLWEEESYLIYHRCTMIESCIKEIKNICAKLEEETKMQIENQLNLINFNLGLIDDYNSTSCPDL